jgi:hypothetical protein
VDPEWSDSYGGYSDYTPAPAYGYGYYPPAYPRFGFGLGLRWRSRYWGSSYTYGDPWQRSGYGYRDYDRPSYHGQYVEHHHGDYRSGSVGSHVSAPSHGEFGGGAHGGRSARTNIRIGR